VSGSFGAVLTSAASAALQERSLAWCMPARGSNAYVPASIANVLPRHSYVPLRLWNWGAIACGVAHALLHAPQAWLDAAATARRLQQQAPLPHRWHLLAQVRRHGSGPVKEGLTLLQQLRESAVVRYECLHSLCLQPTRLPACPCRSAATPLPTGPAGCRALACR